MVPAPPYRVVTRAECPVGRYAPENETHFVAGPWFGGGNPTAYGYHSEAEATEMAARFNAGFVPPRCEGCGGYIVEANGACYECAHPWKPCGQQGCAFTVPHGTRVCVVCQKANHTAAEAARTARRVKVAA